MNDNLNELNTYEHVIQSKIANISKILESLNANMMRKDELNLINYFCDNNKKILAQIENNENNNCLFNLNTISDLKINIDKSSFDNMLISLNNLDFDINSFKGIDIYNKFDSGKYVANRNLYGMNFDSKNDKKEFNLDLPIYNSRFGIKNEDRKTNTEMKLNKIEKNKINKKRNNSTKGKRFK